MTDAAAPRRGPAIAGISAILLAALFGIFDLYDYDLGLARAAGRWIVEHRAVPETNVFSAIHEQRPWVDDKWLFHVFAYAVVDGLGPLAANALRAALLGFLAWLLLRRAASARERIFAAAFAVLATVAAAERFAFRPELFSLAFLAVFAHVLLRDGPLAPRRVLLLVAVQVVWANAHGYFVVGPLLAAAAAAGAAADRLLGRGTAREALQRGALAPLLALACFVNPYGWALVRSPVDILIDLRQNFAFYSRAIVEFVPPLDDLPVLPSDLMAYRTLLLIAPLLALVAFRRVRLLHALPFLMLLAMSLQIRRNASAFAVLAAPLAAHWLALGLDTPRLRRAGGWIARTLAVATPAAAAALALLHVTDRLAVHDRLDKTFGVGFSEVTHPDREIDFLLRELPNGPLFNSFSFGSTFAGRAFPERRPFIDGNTAGYDVAFFKAYADAVEGRADADALVERYGIQSFLLKPGHALTARLLEDERYVPLCLGRHAVVIGVRGRLPDALLERFDLRRAVAEGRFVPELATPPSTFWRRRFPIAELNRARFLGALGRHDLAETAARAAIAVDGELYECWHQLAASQLAAGRPADAIAALDRAILLAPNAAEPRADRALAVLQLGRGAEAERDLVDALSLAPSSGDLWLRRGFVARHLGRAVDARTYGERALALDASLYLAHNLLARLAVERGDRAEARAQLEQSLRVAPGQPQRADLALELGSLGSPPP